MPGFMPDIHGFFGFVPSMTEESAACQRRTRNPDVGMMVVSGFRVRGLRPRPGMTTAFEVHCLSSVMPAHSRPKDGVLSHAYVPAISIRKAKPCPTKRDARHKAGHDREDGNPPNERRSVAMCVAILHRVTTEFRFFVCALTVVSPVQVFLLSRP
jgi:hypothetical protein